MIDTTRMTNGEKASLYDSLLSQHSRKAEQVRALETNITPEPNDQKMIETLKSEMVILERDATQLAQSAY